MKPRLGILVAACGWALAAQAASPLKIELSSDKATYQAGDEITLKVAVTNTADAATPVLVRGFDWADLVRMDQNYERLKELANSGRVGPKASLEASLKQGNLADQIRVEGGPQPLGRLELLEGPSDTAKGMVAGHLFCGTGLKSAQMPAGLSAVQECKLEAKLNAPGVYRFLWSAYPPRSRDFSPDRPLAYSNILEIEITK